MLLPLVLIVIGVVSAAVVAYGTHPAWGEYAHGMQIITVARQLQWPLVALSLIVAIALILLVIAGKRRAWWLIGLAPILALFVHRFATAPVNAMIVLENPQFVSADEAAAWLGDEDYVVGLEHGDAAYAYPFAALYSAPVIVQQEREKRFMLIWSAFANRALAYEIDRGVKARELEIVSIPANALLIYNARLGQFINGVTGQTPGGEAPTGLEAPIRTCKMPWPRWRELHRDTKVLAHRASGKAPRGPIQPRIARFTANTVLQPAERVVVVGIKEPLSLAMDEVGQEPLNLTADGVPVLVFRDPKTGLVRAFDRRVEEDLSPTFVLNTNPKRSPAARFSDPDTGCGWNTDGVAIEGDRNLRGHALKAVPVEEDLYWSVVKRWYPEISRSSDAGKAARRTEVSAAGIRSAS